MSKLIELAERCEKAVEPNRDLDAAICRALADRDAEHHWFSAFGRHMTDHTCPLLTSSLDAAMTLAVHGISVPDVLRHAVERCSRYGEGTFIEALPRFVAAEWLRARASLNRGEGG